MLEDPEEIEEKMTEVIKKNRTILRKCPQRIYLKQENPKTSEEMAGPIYMTMIINYYQKLFWSRKATEIIS